MSSTKPQPNPLSHWADRLEERVLAVGHPSLVGIDPHPAQLPEEFAVVRDTSATTATRAEAMAAFGCALIDVVADRAAAVKPQSAFFEQLGAEGVKAWETVVAHAHDAGLLVLGDVKRGDISSTAAAYANAFLEGDAGTDPRTLCDAITVNPYLGDDAVEPFVEACARTGRGLYVLVRTSNPGSKEIQLHGDPPLCDLVATKVARWGENLRGACGLSSIGAVVGATHESELARLRSLMPHTPFLLPGYGAQGAGASGLRDAFSDGTHPFRAAIVNSSRGISFAYRKEAHAGKGWRQAASDALDEMIVDLRSAMNGATA